MTSSAAGVSVKAFETATITATSQAAAVAGSVGLGAAVEFRDSSMHSDEDIAVSLRLPVLATIPDLGATATGRSR